MTIHRRISISCDATLCQGTPYAFQCPERIDLSARTQVEARERAKAKDWHHINPSRDICGACWKAGRR